MVAGKPIASDMKTYLSLFTNIPHKHLRDCMREFMETIYDMFISSSR